MHLSSTSSASSSCSSVMTSGARKRRQLPATPADRTSTPRSAASFSISPTSPLAGSLVFRSLTNSTATIAPRPRTSPTSSLGRVNHLRPPHARGVGNPRRERLGQDDEVRLDPRVLDTEHPAGAPEPRLDLVGDKDYPVLLAPLFERRQVVVGRHYEPALPQDRFHDQGRHVLRGYVAGEELLQQPGARLSKGFPFFGLYGRPVGVSVGDPVDLSGQRQETLLVRGGLAGQREGQPGAPVESPLEGDDRLASRIHAGHLDRVLYCLRTRVEERSLLAPGNEPRQAPGQLAVEGVGRHRVVRVHETLQLLSDRKSTRLN